MPRKNTKKNQLSSQAEQLAKAIAANNYVNPTLAANDCRRTE
jgi:hypothetical protein